MIMERNYLSPIQRRPEVEPESLQPADSCERAGGRKLAAVSRAPDCPRGLAAAAAAARA